MPGNRSRNKSDATDEPEAQSVLKEILEQLKSMNGRMTKLEEKMNHIEESLSYHSQVVDELKLNVSTIQSTMKPLQQKVYENEQCLLNRSIEIQGVPYHSQENMIDIVLKIGSEIKGSVNEQNIDLAYRNKNKKGIVVRFMQTHVRNKFLSSYKHQLKDSSEHLTAKKLGYKSACDQIYVNEYLSFETRQLFHAAREFKKAKNYKFAWTRNQKVFVKKSEDSDAILIKSKHELKDLS